MINFLLSTAAKHCCIHFDVQLMYVQIYIHAFPCTRAITVESVSINHFLEENILILSAENLRNEVSYSCRLTVRSSVCNRPPEHHTYLTIDWVRV